jgi:hypothetical protein
MNDDLNKQDPRTHHAAAPVIKGMYPVVDFFVVVLWLYFIYFDIAYISVIFPRTYVSLVSGTKYAANSWIHSYNFEKSNLWGCTGAFDYL